MSLVDELASRDIPIVMTAHDYKPACPSYTLFRDGAPCRRCVGHSPHHVVGGRCVKGSVGASLLAFAEASVVRSLHLYDKVSHWVAPSGFAADVLRQAGVASNRISVVANFLPDDELIEKERSDSRDPEIIYAGRLEPTKGVDLLVDVFAKSDGNLGKLVIAGGVGSLVEMVTSISEKSAHVSYLGHLTREQIQTRQLSARASVLPARWEENYPMSVLEARAARLPVVCSNRGGLPEMVEHLVDGVLFDADDESALRDALRHVAQDEEAARRMGDAGYGRLLRENRSSTHYEALMDVYGSALSR
jgi:glycosyltransferase involved in cell wall biosynthesis